MSDRRGFLSFAGLGAVTAAAALGPESADAAVAAPTVAAPPTGISSTDMASILAAVKRTPAGGRVLLVPGEYVVDSLHLPSNTYLDLGGATIRQVHPTRGSDVGAAVRNGDFVGGNDNITIANGTITLGAGSRGRIVSFVNARNLTLLNLTIAKGTGDFADWMLYLRHCDDVRVLGCRVTGGTLLGEDGIHIKECARVVVDDCLVSAGDDAIAVVQQYGCTRPNSDITVSNCVVRSYAAHLIRVSVWAGEQHGIHRVVLSNIAGSAPPGAKGTPVVVDSPSPALLTEVTLDNIDLACGAAPGCGLHILRVADCSFRGIRLSQVADKAFLVQNSARLTFDDCHAQQRSGTTNDAWVIDSSIDVTLTNCSATRATNSSFRVSGTGSARVTFVACRSSSPAAHGWVLAGVADVTLVGCALTGGVEGVYCDPTLRPSGVRVLGCTLLHQQNKPIKNPPSSTTWIGNANGPELAPGGHRFSGPLGFYGATPVARPSGVAPTAAGLHAALVQLGLIAE